MVLSTLLNIDLLSICYNFEVTSHVTFVYACVCPLLKNLDFPQNLIK